MSCVSKTCFPNSSPSLTVGLCKELLWMELLWHSIFPEGDLNFFNQEVVGRVLSSCMSKSRLLWYQDTWSCTFPLLFPTSTTVFVALVLGRSFLLKDILESNCKIREFLMTLGTLHCCRTYPNQGFWGVVWKLWAIKSHLDASLLNSRKHFFGHSRQVGHE